MTNTGKLYIQLKALAKRHKCEAAATLTLADDSRLRLTVYRRFFGLGPWAEVWEYAKFITFAKITRHKAECISEEVKSMPWLSDRKEVTFSLKVEEGK